jgi:membrane-associated PAP2 superfamily phosphatase
MGLYQVARGEHFLSHTLATAALAWLFAACLARWLKPAEVSSTN